MNKTELIAAVAEKAGLSKKDADAAVAAVFDAMTAELKKGEKFSSSASAPLKFVSALQNRAATPRPAKP